MIPRCQTNSRFARATWHLHNPIVPVLCLAALVFSVVRLPRDRYGQMQITNRLAGRPVPLLPGSGTASLYFLRSPEGTFETIDPEVQSWDTLARAIQSEPQNLYIAAYNVGITRRGMWYPIHQTSRRSLTVGPANQNPGTGAELSDVDQALIRDSFSNWLATRAIPRYTIALPPLQSRSPREELISSVHWPSVLFNSTTLLALLILPLSLAGLPRYLRVWRSSRHLRHQRCGNCTYNLAATPTAAGTIRCPECGSDWTPADLGRT